MDYTNQSCQRLVVIESNSKTAFDGYDILWLELLWIFGLDNLGQ